MREATKEEYDEYHALLEDDAKYNAAGFGMAGSRAHQCLCAVDRQLERLGLEIVEYHGSSDHIWQIKPRNSEFTFRERHPFCPKCAAEAAVLISGHSQLCNCNCHRGGELPL